jgi:hypothetical protein
MKSIRFCTCGVLLAGTALLGGCVEEKTTRSTSSYTGLNPIPTRVQGAPKPKEPSNFPNPFAWMGNLFASKPKSAQALKINSPNGVSTQVPPGFTGQTNFTGSDGKNYRLNFKDGALVGVDQPANKPPAPTPTPQQ